MKKSRQSKKERQHPPPPVESDHDDDDDDDNHENKDNDNNTDNNTIDNNSINNNNDNNSIDNNTIDNNNDNTNDDATPKRVQRVHSLSLTKTMDFNETLRQRGVLYIARVPPRMNPTKLKALLSDFGHVTRIYLVEEDVSHRKRRRKDGGSGSKRYTEGWVEFAHKKIAKIVAANLNQTQISNHKRNYHYGDLWNLKYLSKFQWTHLTEKVAYERRIREQKLRVEMMQAKKENASYTKLLETGKALDQIENRKRKRLEKERDGSRNQQVAATVTQTRRPPKQIKVLEDGKHSTKKAILSSLV